MANERKLKIEQDAMAIAEFQTMLHPYLFC